jgi:hypothetical protein
MVIDIEATILNGLDVPAISTSLRIGGGTFGGELHPGIRRCAF